METAIQNQTTEKVSLIEGTFSARDARQLLNALLDIKINYHKLKRLSILEGNDQDACIYDSSRIDTLIAQKEELRALFSEMNMEGKTLKIKGDITIEIE